MHHAVAADDDQRLDPVGDALAGQVERLVGVAARQVADHEPGVAQPRQRGVAGARALALARGGVGEERDLARAAGHAQTLGHGDSQLELRPFPARPVGADPQLDGVLVAGGADRLGQPAERVEAQVGGEATCRGRRGSAGPSHAEQQDLAVPPGLVGAGADVVVGDRLRDRRRRRPAGRTARRRWPAPGQRPAHVVPVADAVGAWPTPPRSVAEPVRQVERVDVDLTGVESQRRRSSSSRLGELVAARPRRRSRIRAITSEITNSTSIGIARISIVNGSVDGVATAAKTNVPRMIHGRCAPERLARDARRRG